MRLTSRARHAVRLVLEVARHGTPDRPVRLREVARRTGLSKRFLEQLAMVLKSHSLLRGVCGRNGGYLLARPAGEVTIGDILVAVIGPLRLSVCAESKDLCLSSEFCECRLVWMLLERRIGSLLDEITLGDLMDRAWVADVRTALSSGECAVGASGVAPS